MKYVFTELNIKITYILIIDQGDIRRVYSGIESENLDYPSFDGDSEDISQPSTSGDKSSSAKHSRTQSDKLKTDRSVCTYTQSKDSTLPDTDQTAIDPIHENFVQLKRHASDILQELIETGTNFSILWLRFKGIIEKTPIFLFRLFSTLFNF